MSGSSRKSAFRSVIGLLYRPCHRHDRRNPTARVTVEARSSQRMRRCDMTRRFLLVLVFACLPSLALAAGLRDGSYRVEVTEAGPYQQPHIRYIVVLENGSQMGFALLAAEGGPWRYGAGSMAGGDQASGSLFTPDGSAYGTFNLTITQDGQISGVLYEGASYLYLTGARFF